MTVRFALATLTLVGLVGASGSVSPSPASIPTVSLVASDSALDELAVGRYWHAAILLRAEGAADGSPAEVLTLATAEAGWENWPAVRELLEGAEWLDTFTDPAGSYLLGRALEHAERWRDAADHYAEYRARAALAGTEGMIALARQIRAEWMAGSPDVALELLPELRPAPHLRSWLAVELGLAAAESGDVDGVVALAGHAVEPAAASALWRAEGDALLERGDSARAIEAFRALTGSQSVVRAAIAHGEVGALLLASGDVEGARVSLRTAWADGGPSTRARAAGLLVEIGGLDDETAREYARALVRSGDGARALVAWDQVHAASEAGRIAMTEADRLARARLMATLAPRQAEALEEFRAIRETTEDPRIGARNLEAWTQMRRRQGLSAQVGTLRRWLLEEYPESPEAAEVGWSQGSAAEGRGALDAALERYAFVATNARTHARAGQSRMRSGQIHLRRGDLAKAAEVFEQYLADFPEGRRWQEAAYWAGRTRFEIGDSVRGREHLERALSQPIDYYAVMAADLLGVDFELNLPTGAASVEPGWLSEGLVRLDALTEAGLDRGADAEIDRLRTRGEGSRGPRLRLAEALIERGRTIDGINLGWALLRDEGSWDRQIVHVTYPFPYRELVRREAAEWGIDPFMMAAIIRQESAFKADIVSHAGAIGLMQVMPPTGAELARAHGPDGFTRESLTRPEVNLHLGAAFFVDMSRRYDNELPLVLSAYNAGPTRATRWRRYPEAVDPLRFTERIPFTETRGYVKSVRRNLGLYRVLYGQE